MMAEEFEIIEKAIGPVLEIEERVSMWRMPATFGRNYKRIAEYLDSQGAECVDAPYARYLEMDWESEIGKGKLATIIDMLVRKWHFQVGMPSSKELPGEGELKGRILETRRYARALHRGPYQKVGPTYAALCSWAKEQGVSLENEAVECYLNDPREVGKEALETVILIPVREE
jgi:effector-binding domain-containing protein